MSLPTDFSARIDMGPPGRIVFVLGVTGRLMIGTYPHDQSKRERIVSLSPSDAAALARWLQENNPEPKT